MITVVGWVISHRTRTETRKPLLQYQLIALEELNPTEQGIYNDLLTAVMEINGVYKDNGGQWMSVSELVEYYIPPFVRDQAWKVRGRLT